MDIITADLATEELALGWLNRLEMDIPYCHNLTELYACPLDPFGSGRDKVRESDVEESRSGSILKVRSWH